MVVTPIVAYQVQKLGSRLTNKCRLLFGELDRSNRRQANNCTRNKSLGLWKADLHP